MRDQTHCLTSPGSTIDPEGRRPTLDCAAIAKVIRDIAEMGSPAHAEGALLVAGELAEFLPEADQGAFLLDCGVRQ